tara:strand:+ start:3373 stop:4839 length:1467 start_codon:yes stop_codon:yes gene_type:complete
MDSLDRKMFSPSLARGSEFGDMYFPPTVTREFVYQEDGGVNYVEKDQEGNIVVNEPVDLTLSETRNPTEALQRQRNKTNLDRLQTGIMALPFLRTPGMIFNFGKTALKPLLSKIPAFTTRAGPEVGKYGTQRVFSTTNPNQITGLTETGKNVALGTGAVAGVTALESAKPGPVDISADLAKLNVTKPKDSKLKPMGETLGTKKEEPKGPPIVGFKDQPLVSKVISSPDFNRFLSNLSSSLTGTGSLATGGAKGASGALEEKLANQATGVEPMDTAAAKRNVEVNEELSAAVNMFDKTELDIGRIEYAINLLETEGGTGLAGFFGNLLDRASALVGKDGKEFKDQNPRTQIDSILTAIRQENIRQLLGESGRTISNLDREIVAEIFGSITVDSPKAVLIEKLNQVLNKFRRDLNKQKGKISSRVNYFVDTRQDSPIAFQAGQVAAPIRRILSINDTFNYDVPEYIPGQDRLARTTSSSPITDIEYVEGT